MKQENRLRKLMIAVFLALAVNTAGLYLVVQVNAYIHTPEKKVTTTTRTLIIQERHKKRHRLHHRSQLTKTRTKMVPMPIPNLPSNISSDQLMPSLDDVDFTNDLMQTSQGFDADLVLKEEAVDERPKILRRVAPDYPQAAEDQGIEGYVLLKLRVSAAGRVEGVWVIEAKPPGVFENAAIQAAKHYLFSPAKFKGDPVAVLLKQKIIFKLEE